MSNINEDAKKELSNIFDNLVIAKISNELTIKFEEISKNINSTKKRIISKGDDLENNINEGKQDIEDYKDEIIEKVETCEQNTISKFEGQILKNTKEVFVENNKLIQDEIIKKINNNIN